MTEKQIEKVKIKIDTYKKALAADKKFWGGQYHDGQGIRYIILEQFIKIKDYKGGLRYLNWFEKNFPDDRDNPFFLFESTFILFKCKKLDKAENRLHQTFFSNTYLLDKFLGKPILKIDKTESSSWKYESFVNNFFYSSVDPEFIEFGNWINEVLKSPIFLAKANEFFEIEKALETLPPGKKRTELILRSSKISHS